MAKARDKRAQKKAEKQMEKMRAQGQRNQPGERNMNTGQMKQAPEEQGGGGGGRGAGGGKKRRGPVKQDKR